jgi:hypothetical protein
MKESSFDIAVSAAGPKVVEPVDHLFFRDDIGETTRNTKPFLENNLPPQIEKAHVRSFMS